MKTKKTAYSIALLMGVALMGTQGAFADVTAVYTMTLPNGNGAETIQYADKQHVRVDMVNANNIQMTMLKLGDKIYLISGKVVQDMDQLANMMALIRGVPDRGIALLRSGQKDYPCRLLDGRLEITGKDT